ncbi:MAG: polyketide synthase dehydratase domain-containing protein, partial [Kitasatospora sp.]|nr:polyketide synthase dehydratase domain-containing protein [Kitasatospora sp.]
MPGRPEREPIAIVGMHGMMPRSADLGEFWEHLVAGRDLVTEIPSDRWDWREYYSESAEDLDRTTSKWGGFLDDVASFDARFFGISPREADLMDPQQRLFLQTAYRAVEDAGYRPSDLSRTRTGLFVGVATHDYHELMREAGVPVEAYTTTGLFHAILANRVSYLLNLKGPSFPIDTACSSSLVAIRSAVEAIRSGSCEVAVAGGVNLLLAPMIYISFARAGMLSPDGRCKTFDAGANGYVRGEGAGALVLKPLAAAERDGDHIHAVIRGSAVNHGGRVNTLTTPNPNAQAELVVTAWEEGGVDPATVGYLEMHGTGTALGDPIEVNGVKKAYRDLRDRAGLPRLTEPTTLIGSVKTNTGHLEAAAGMAGIFKVILAMKHGTLPGTLHLNEVNPHIQLDGSPLRIVRETTPWPRPTGPDGRELPRRAGVSSFGFGGVNGHVLLEEYPARPVAAAPGPHPREQVLVLSARTEERLRAYAAAMAPAVTAAPGDGEDPARVRAGLVEATARLLDVAPAEVPTDEPLEDLGLGPARLVLLRDRIRETHTLPAGFDDAVAGRSLDAIAHELAAGSGTPGGALPDLARTLQLGREPMAHRLALVCASAAELAAELRKFAETGELGPDGVYGVADTRPGPAAVDLSDPRAVARHWVSGGSVDWAALHADRPVRRVPLPGYPFAPTRHWFRTPAAATTTPAAITPAGAGAAAHPLLDGPVAVAEGAGFRKWLPVGDRIVAEHRIHGRPVFPGVGHLEFAAAALARLRPGRRHRLARVAWLRTVAVDGPGRELTVRLVERGEAVEYQVLAEEDGRAVVCSQGRWEPAAEAPVAAVALTEVARRCPRVLDRDAVYRGFAALGIDYGPFFRGLHEVRIGDREVLARVALDPADAADAAPAAGYAFHPTVTDAALQAITTLEFADPAARPGRTRLPFSLESAELLAPLPADGWVHATAVGDDGYDVEVLDAAGRVCARFGEVTVREEKDR